MKKILFILITCLFFVASADAANKRFTLVIDAGHGGGDTGAVGKGKTREKDLTLKFALAFGKLVEKNCPDVNVIYTRKTDKFVELYRRAEIANNNKADLFISIHINALPKGHVARGFQTYTLGRSRRTGKSTGVLENLEVAKRENAVIYLEKNYKQTYHGYDPNSPESNIMFEFVQDKNMENSAELAKYMQRYVCQATGRADMGAHQDNLAVLRLTSMPGCLIELGFISTPDEERYMNTSTATEQYARGIYNAFAAYKKRHGGSITIPYMPNPIEEKAPAKTEVKKKEEPQKEVTENALATNGTQEPQKEEPQAIAALVETHPTSVTPEPQETPAPTPSTTPETSQKASEASAPQKVAETPVATPVAADAPVFKVQILVSSQKLKAGDSRLKGQTGVDSYVENGMTKYTVGASENYNEIYHLRKSLLDKFPEAFIIAFKDGKRMDVQQAIREFKNKRVK
ncbi:MAG: N-acetylmuramoyl-L-alanine amidase [Prevotella sp.]|nr:N-acetylmuramoyl-L-alanine amidase [Prevotella sp.]